MFKFFSRIFAKILGKAVNIPSEAASTAIGYAVSNVITAPIKPLQRELNKKFPYEKLNVGELQSLLTRNEITEEEFNEELSGKGFNMEKINQLKSLARYLPTVSDVVRFAVREAFYDDYAGEYGLDKEYPEQLTKKGMEQGARQEDLKYFWRSHWELPSLSAGFNMLHRGIISSTQLKDLFKAHDIIPYWRDKMEKLSFSPITRVDIRRLYKTGVLDLAGVKKAYLDVGYDGEKAGWLAEFTAKDTQSADRDLTKTEILSCYDEGYLSENELKTNLEGLGYDAQETEIIFGLSQSKKLRKYTNKYITNIYKMYVKDDLAKNEVVFALNKLNLSGEVIDEYLAVWELDKIPKISYPTKADTLRWFGNEKITEEETRQMLSSIGYSSKWVELYIEEKRPEE